MTKAKIRIEAYGILTISPLLDDNGCRPSCADDNTPNRKILDSLKLGERVEITRPSNAKAVDRCRLLFSKPQLVLSVPVVADPVLGKPKFAITKTYDLPA